MRFTLTLIAILLVSSLGLAQTIIFNDSFQDDTNKWIIFSVKIQNTTIC